MSLSYGLPYSIIRVSGADTVSFLQGQLTADVETVFNTPGLLAAHCNPKGRIYTLFRLWATQEAFYLRLPTDLLEKSFKTLSKFAAFSKVQLKVEENQRIVATPQAFSPADSITTYSVTPDIAEHILFEAETPSSTLSWDDYRYHLIQHAIPEVFLDTSEIFLPAHLNLASLGAISFTKGCYVGQEIVARMHYLGKNKVQTHYVALHPSLPNDLKPGDCFYSTEPPEQALEVVWAVYQQGLWHTLLTVPHTLYDAMSHTFLRGPSNTTWEIKHR